MSGIEEQELLLRDLVSGKPPAIPLPSSVTGPTATCKTALSFEAMKSHPLGYE